MRDICKNKKNCAIIKNVLCCDGRIKRRVVECKKESEAEGKCFAKYYEMAS